MEIKVTNLIKLYIILLLSSGPKYGYEIIKEIEEKLERRISASQVYPFLSRLKRNSYVAFNRSGTREKKTYHLTPKGRSFVRQTLSKFGTMLDAMLAQKITVCAHCSCEIYKGVHKEKIKGRVFSFCCSHCARAYKKEKIETGNI